MQAVASPAGILATYENTFWYEVATSQKRNAVRGIISRQPVQR